jgi:hypothetical protein
MKISALCLLLSGLLLSACGGGGGGDSASDDPMADSDGNGISDAIDVDRDGDGLIEVGTLEQLDVMRNDPGGTGQRPYYAREDGIAARGEGCPGGVCSGFELVADLDFDTNGNGVADIGDQYYDYC